MTELRPGEVTVEAPPAADAGLVFIGRIHTPWTDRKDCPHQGRADGPECRIEIFAPWVEALDGVGELEQLQVLYWLDRSRRDLVVQRPRSDGRLRGTFALRSPMRPNPIGSQSVRLLRVDGPNVFVQGLDCLDGTPLLDLKPIRCSHSLAESPR